MSQRVAPRGPDVAGPYQPLARAIELRRTKATRADPDERPRLPYSRRL